MANSRSSGDYKEYATVNTQPSGAQLGYWTNEVCLRDKIKKGLAKDKMFFSIRESESDSSQASDTSVITVTLQFKCDGDVGWQDYKDLNEAELVVGNRLTIEDIGAAVRWRAGVKDGNYTSGELTFGFDW
jgi:hypothetical protein